MKRLKIRTVEAYNECMQEMYNCAAFIHSSYNFEECKEVMNEFIVSQCRLIECEGRFKMDDYGNAISFLG